MKSEDEKTYIANEDLPTDFSLEDILAEYRSSVPDKPSGEESRSERSRRIVMEALDQTISEASFSSIDDLIGAEDGEQAAPEPRPEPKSEPKPEPVPEVKMPREPEIPVLTERDQALIDEITGEFEPVEEPAPRKPAPPAPAPEPDVKLAGDGADSGSYASRDYPEPEEERESGAERFERVRKRAAAPILSLLALIALKREQHKKADTSAAMHDEEYEDVPEPDPEKAARLYGAQMRSYRLRARIATLLSLALVYLSVAYYSSLPLTGALGDGVRTISLVMLILQITVMVSGLDVFTSGVMSLVRRRPGAESLVAVSCVLSLLDAAVIAVTGNAELGIPFCAVAALSLTFAMWGAYNTCRGYRSSFRLLTMSKKFYSVTGESGISGGGVALLKSRRATRGFITRSEEADLPEYIYSFLTPMIFALVVVLGLLASVAHGQPKAVLHCISVMAAVAATFTAGICFSLPFSITARRLFQSGAAIAGWSGVRDIGRSRHVVITDADIFPQGTVEVGGIRILEGAFTDKVISYTGSVVSASGSSLASAFSDLIRRNGYSISRVENFQPHDGGGMTAMVNGETVYVGSSGFMNLMGIRVPQKLATKSSVYTAVNGALVGIFAIDYKPLASVQDALVLLLHSNRKPIFAIRDFNITPVMIKQKFHMPTDIFEFPSFSERFRISAAEPDEDSRIAAVISREGMGPLVDAADRGRRLYNAARLGTVISAAGSVIGVLIMFLLCWAKAFDSATAANALAFMLLWLIPSLVVSWGLRR